MEEYLTIAVGALICVLAIINMTGNISILHSHHTKRVAEENKKAFGKLVGLGTLIIGISFIIFGVLHLIVKQTNIEVLSIISTVQLIICLVVGLAISFYAMKKYNGGIF